MDQGSMMDVDEIYCPILLAVSNITCASLSYFHIMEGGGRRARFYPKDGKVAYTLE